MAKLASIVFLFLQKLNIFAILLGSIMAKVIRVPWYHLKNVLYTKKASKMDRFRCLTSSTYRMKDKQNTQTTVDASDVKLFSNHMNEWWDTNGPMKALHSMNLIRVPFVRDGLVQCSTAERNSIPLKDKKILDVGCGGGILSEGLARIGAEVTGIDASNELISLAELHKNVDHRIANNKPTYYHTTVEEHVTQFKDYYDAVVASEVIEHVNEQELFVKSCVQALKPGGRIFFTTPNRTPMSRLLVIFMAENVLRLLPRGSHQYDKFITPIELSLLLERNNCHVELSYGLSYNFWSNTWDFGKSQSLMYALQAVKLN